MTHRLYERGDELLGRQIAAQARKVTSQKLIHLTSKHEGVSLKLKGSAYCVIEVPLKSVHERKR